MLVAVYKGIGVNSLKQTIVSSLQYFLIIVYVYMKPISK